MRVIILAAGHSLLLDGYHKLLVKDPATNKTIMDYYLEIFEDKEITVVVGYKALEIMNQYPKLHYVYNPDWVTAGNSSSLAIAIDNRPCYVISSDIFIDKEVIFEIDKKYDNCVLTEKRDARGSNALNCVVSNTVINEVYLGPVRNVNDPETLGVYKITNRDVLINWKNNCQKYPNLLIGENINYNIDKIYSVPLGNHWFFEVNTVYDYIKLIKERCK